MANAVGSFSLRSGYQLVITVNQASQNIPGNYSTVNVYVDINDTTGNGSWQYGATGWSSSVDGQGDGGSFTYDFRNYGSLRLLATSKNIGHNSDGTRSIGFSAYCDGSNSSTIGSAGASGSMGLTTIPRASTVSWAGGTPNPPDIGSTQTLNTNRASTGFTHTVDWSYGTLTGNVGTNIGASVSWTIPTTLLTQIPNSTSGNGTFTTKTYSGATLIGTTTTGFTVRAADTVVPTWTSVGVSEADSNVSTKVGVYVQNASKLGWTITGAAGVSGSTITAQTFTAGGNTGVGASGSLTQVLTQSGTVPVIHSITDSRGRTKSQTTNINVLAYSPPIFNSITVSRALSDGTLSPDNGTFLRVDVSAAAVSLLNGATQKNSLTFNVYTKLRTSSTWVLSRAYTPGGLSFNGNFVVTGPFLVDKAYDVRVEATDVLSTSTNLSVTAVAAVFMHWGPGLGVGKFWEQGAIDTGPGGIYDNGVKVLNENDLSVTTALLDATYRGANSSKVALTPGGTLSSSAYKWMAPYVPQGSRQVRLLKTKTETYIAGQSMEEKYPLTLGANWYSYSDITSSKVFNDHIVANKLASGLIVLSGLLRVNGTPADTSLIATLPAGMAPDVQLLLPVMMGDVTRNIKILPDGTIRVYGTDWPSSTYLSLDGITFWPAGSVTWTPVGSGGSSFGANFEAWADTTTWGVPKWYKDPYGVVWFQGLVRVKVATSTDNTNIITMPSGYQVDLQQHFRGATYGGSNYAGLGGAPTDGLNWKTNSPGTVGAYISISGVGYLTPEAITKNTWKVVPALSNSWVNYVPASFGGAQYTRREDGLCMTRGLISSGTLAATALMLDEELQPASGKIIMIGMSTNATQRVDISSSRLGDSIGPGNVVLSLGTNGWCSLDGLKWVP